MAWFLGQSLLFIVLAFVLGLFVGWLIWGRRRVVRMSSSTSGSSGAAPSAAPVIPAPASARSVESATARESSPALVGAGSPHSASGQLSTVDISTEPTLDLGSDSALLAASTVDGGARAAEPSTVDASTSSSEVAGADASESSAGADTVVIEPAAASPTAADDSAPSAADTVVIEPAKASSRVVAEPAPAVEPAPAPEPAPAVDAGRGAADSAPSAADTVVIESAPAAAPSPPAADDTVVIESAPAASVSESGSESAASDAEVEPLVSGTTPSGAGAATGSEPAADDDLQRIEGIGPKMAAALNAAGIRTFRQLADTDEPTLRAAIRAAGLRFAPSLVTWARQAQLLADGDEEGFGALTKQLTAGRDVRRG